MIQYIQGNVSCCAFGSYTILCHIHCYSSKFFSWIAHWNFYTFDHCSWKIHYANRKWTTLFLVFLCSEFWTEKSSNQDRENSHDDLFGRCCNVSIRGCKCIFTQITITVSIKALSDKIQRNAGRLKPYSILVLDFEKVLSIDGGATLGLIDGISFSLKFNPTLKIHIENIKVSLFWMTVRLASGELFTSWFSRTANWKCCEQMAFRMLS